MRVELLKQGDLTLKEAGVLTLLSEGEPVKRMGDLLGVGQKTVEKEIASARQRAGVRNSRELITYGFAMGLIRALPCFMASVLMYFLVIVLGVNGVSAELARRVPRPIRTTRVAMRRPTERLGSEFG